MLDGYARMAGLVWTLPEQLQDALRLSTLDVVPLSSRDVRSVAVAGMGGSAIGGDIIRSLIAYRCAVPVVVVRDYHLPAIVGPQTLFFAISYSGNTEETLAAYREARHRGCQMVVVTSGGRLGRLARRHRQPLIEIPTGLPPRAAIGYLTVPLAVLLERTGIVKGLSQQFQQAARLLLRRRAAYRRFAKRIASCLENRLPLVYSAARLLDPVADRWRCQLNENAKVMCHTSSFPEHNHNEIVGMGSPRWLCRSVLIVLLDNHIRRRMALRIDLTLDIVRGTFQAVKKLPAEGKTALERVFSLVMLGDMVSVELARRRGVDPLPVQRIERLKSRMRGS